ncbi:MAG: hypothetical protein AB7G23_02880 [Vicinamibacterales bacterium]
MPYADPDQRALPWQGGSETSHEGAVAARVFGGSQRDQVLAFYEACGTRGATDEEVARGTGVKQTSVCARRNELLDVLEMHGTRTGSAGVRCQVWRLAQKRETSCP